MVTTNATFYATFTSSTTTMHVDTITITITIKAPACEDDEWQPIVLPCPVFGVWVAGPALPSGCSAPDMVVMMMIVAMTVKKI